MAPNDILAQLNISLPGIQVEKIKTVRDNDRAILVYTTNGKEMIFEYLSPGVWSIESVKHYKRRTNK